MDTASSIVGVICTTLIISATVVGTIAATKALNDLSSTLSAPPPPSSRCEKKEEEEEEESSSVEHDYGYYYYYYAYTIP